MASYISEISQLGKGRFYADLAPAFDVNQDVSQNGGLCKADHASLKAMKNEASQLN